MKSPMPLKGFLSLQFGIVAVLPIVTITFLVWFFMMPAIQTRTTIQHQAMARSIAGQISAHLKGGERQLTALAEYLQVRDPHSDQELFGLLDAECGSGEFFEALFITNSEHTAIKMVGLAQSRRSKRADFMDLDLTGRSFIHTAKEIREAAWSKTFLSTVSSRMAVALTVPLADGFITGEITLDNLSEFISLLPVESEFLTLVIDGQGMIVADSQKRRWGQVLDLKFLPTEGPVDGTRFSSSAFELEGERMLGMLVEMKEAGWKVLAAQPIHKAFKPIRDTFKLIALGLSIALALALSISWLQAGNLAKLFQAYADSAQSIAKGRYTLQWPKASTREFHELGQSLQRMAERIRAREKALIDSESHLQITLDSIGDAVIATDDQGLITRMNPMAEKLTGWQSEEAIGRSLEVAFQIVNGRTREPVENPVDKVLAEGEVVGLANHTVLIAKDGHEYQIADSGAPIRQADGSFIGVVLVFRDVTEAYAQEQRIRDNERELKDLVAHVPGVVFRFTADPGAFRTNLLISSNQVKMNEILGLNSTPEEFFDDYLSCLPDEDKPRFVTQARDAIEGLKPWYYEGRFIKPSGEEIWIDGHAIPRQLEDKVVFYGVLMDITERKRVEDSLRITQFSFDSANIGIYRIAPDAQIVEVNQKAAQILGYTKEELEALTVMDLDLLLTRDAWGLNWQALVDKGMHLHEREHRKKDGSVIPVEVCSNLLQYENQQYAITFVQDITERKRTEESLRLTQFIFDKAPIGIWRMGAAGEVLDVNEHGCASLGFSREELCRMSVFDFAPGFTTGDWENGTIALNEVGSRTIEAAHQRKSGEVFPIQVIENQMRFEDQEFRVAFVQDITGRKQMEKTLKENEQRLDLALSGANEGIWDWRMDEDAIFFDARYYTMAGYRPDEFPPTFDEFEKRLHIDDLERVKSVIAEYLAGALAIYAVEFRFLCKDGSYMWIQGKGKIVARDDEGNPIRFIGTHADITERKQAEEALRENEQLLGNILESINEGIVVLDHEYRYTNFNRGMELITNTPRHEVLGQRPWEAFSFIKNSAVEENMKKAMRGEEIGSIEIFFSLPHNPNSWTKASFSSLKDADGHIDGVVGVISDITQLKQSEEELRRLRNYLSNIIDSMPSILVAVDRDGNVTQWNSQTEQITGLSFEEAWAQPLTKVFPRLAGEVERIGTAIKERRVISSPKVPRKLEQETRFEDVTIFPLVANGVEGAVIRVDDVTEQVRLEEVMIQSEKMLSVGGLAAGMAHEINNPLAGMLQTAGVMANRLGTHIDIPANRKAAEAAGITLEAIEQFMHARGIPRMIDTITASGKRVANIVENMLSFARKDDASVSSHQVDKLLDKTIELAATDYDLKKQYDFKRIKIVKVYADNVPAVPCRESKIQQVVLNILSNGAQAMQVSRIENPQFTIRTYMDHNRNMACMEVEDNGPGMDEATCKHVFDPFFTTKQKGVGTGLGLSVSYFIVTENHNGEMAVESRPGGGAKFIIRLPLERAQ